MGDVLVVADGLLVGRVTGYTVSSDGQASIDAELVEDGAARLVQSMPPKVTDPPTRARDAAQPYDYWTLAASPAWPKSGTPRVHVRVEDREAGRVVVKAVNDELRCDVERLPSVVRLVLTNHGMKRDEAEAHVDWMLVSMGFGCAECGGGTYHAAPCPEGRT